MMAQPDRPFRLGYLSPAPRVSTRDGVGSPGPRTHVLGFIHAGERRGWRIDRLVVGDLLSPRHVNEVIANSAGAGYLRRLTGDLSRLGMSWWFGRRAVRELLPQAPQAVYERLAVMQSFGWRFQRRGIPWILETNGIHFEEAARDRRSLALTGLARRIELNAYRSADLVVTISDALSEAVVRVAGIPAQRVLSVPNGVDLELFRAPPTRPPAEDVVIIGFIGAMIPWQGLDLLLDAVAAMQRNGRGRFRLELAGDGPVRVACQQQAERLGLDAHWHGRLAHEAVGKFLAGIHVGYSGQRTFSGGVMYGSPLKLYEYGAAGIPFIASDHADAVALADGERHGFLFRSDSLEDLVRCLERVWEGRAKLAEQGGSYHACVAQEHTWDARVARVADAIRTRFPDLLA